MEVVSVKDADLKNKKHRTKDEIHNTKLLRQLEEENISFDYD